MGIATRRMGWESDEMSRLCLLWRGAGENGIVARALLSWAGVVDFLYFFFPLCWGQKKSMRALLLRQARYLSIFGFFLKIPRSKMGETKLD